MTNEERIQKEAEDIVNTHYQNKLEKEAETFADSIDRRGCGAWQGMYRGYMAGVLKEHDRMVEQLKQERNKGIDEAIEVAYNHDVVDNWYQLKLKLESLKH